MTRTRRRARTPTTDLILEIKRRLWYGEPLDSISRDTAIPIPTLGNIRSGQRYADIRWPNCAVGALPEIRSKQIVAARRVARKQLHLLVAKLLKETERQARRDGTGKFFANEKPQTQPTQEVTNVAV